VISEEQIKEVKSKLVENYQPDKIILFGSYARDDANENSDLDLIIVKDSVENQNRLERCSDAIIANRGRTSAKGLMKGIGLDVFVYTSEELSRLYHPYNFFISSALRDGKLLYERQGRDRKSVA